MKVSIKPVPREDINENFPFQKEIEFKFDSIEDRNAFFEWFDHFFIKTSKDVPGCFDVFLRPGFTNKTPVMSAAVFLREVSLFFDSIKPHSRPSQDNNDALKALIEKLIEYLTSTPAGTK